MWDNGYGHMSWGWGAGMILMLLLVALVVAIVVLLVRAPEGSGRRDGGPHWGGDQAERLLRERFARGELTEEEFSRALDVLRRGRSTPSA